jgi:hypothetical protein
MDSFSAPLCSTKILSESCPSDLWVPLRVLCELCELCGLIQSVWVARQNEIYHKDHKGHKGCTKAIFILTGVQQVMSVSLW